LKARHFSDGRVVESTEIDRVLAASITLFHLVVSSQEVLTGDENANRYAEKRKKDEWMSVLM
jgi:dihydroorotase